VAKMMLSKNFSLAEFIYSRTAEENKIDNTMPVELLPAAKALCEKVLQPLRDTIGKPVNITSGYRCKALNRLVNSKDTSQHIKAEAADIKVSGMTPAEVVQKIIEVCPIYDQLIEEYGVWTHVSYKRNGKNRKQVLNFK
jgi:zinc D-Ala-D-Ala carboxypeptidase